MQRGNPEIQRRAQEVINHCWALGEHNPILAIHDVGAGGICNAFPELVDGAGRGASFDLRKVPLEESGLAPKEIWCNESQERYVMAVAPEALPLFEAMCERERCPFAVVGVATDDSAAGARRRPRRRARPIDMPMDVLLGKPPKMHRDVQRVGARARPLDLTGVALEQVAFDVLRHPTVASKRFLDHDRRPHGRRPEPPRPDGRAVAGAGGRLRRDAGRLPRLSRRGDGMGERTPLAALDAPASGRMAVGEAITNLLAAPIELGASSSAATGWRPAASPAKMRRCTTPCSAVGMELCPALGISVPVGKDSPVDAHALERRRRAKQVTAPVR